MLCLSRFCTVGSKIVLIKEEFILKNGVKRVRKGLLLDSKRNVGSDDNKNGIIYIISCYKKKIIFMISFT